MTCSCSISLTKGLIILLSFLYAEVNVIARIQSSRGSITPTNFAFNTSYWSYAPALIFLLKWQWDYWQFIRYDFTDRKISVNFSLLWLNGKAQGLNLPIWLRWETANHFSHKISRSVFPVDDLKFCGQFSVVYHFCGLNGSWRWAVWCRGTVFKERMKLWLGELELGKV